MFSSIDSFTPPPSGGLPPSTQMFQHAPPSPITSIHSNSSWHSHDQVNSSYCKVEYNLKGCIHCETSYRALQQENHDLRKRMGEFKAKLAFADENLRQEGSRQRVLERCLAKLTMSLEEAQMRSVDVIEENYALRADYVHRGLGNTMGDQSPLPSPLDRQIQMQSKTEEPIIKHDMPSATEPSLPAITTSPTTLPSTDLATFQRSRETRKAAKKAKAQRERTAAFAAIPQSFYIRSQQEPASPCRSPMVESTTCATRQRKGSTASFTKDASGACNSLDTNPHQLQSAKRLPRPSVLPAPTRRSTAPDVDVMNRR